MMSPVSEERSFDPGENKPVAPAPHPNLILWVLEKGTQLLRCELRDDSWKAGGWVVLIFKDGELSFSQQWPLEASARFAAASLRRERLRDGWSDPQVASRTGGRTVSIKDELALLARNNCVYALELMFNLHDALGVLGWSMDYEFINMDALAVSDAGRGYPSPTLLWKGKELFGMPIPMPPFTPC